MEELDLGLLLVGQELHVVDDEDVVVTVGLLEPLDTPLVGDRVDEVVGEPLAGDVADVQFRVLLKRRVGDGLDEVCLAEPGARVDEHGVVRAGRGFRDASRHCGRVLVVGADHETFEHVARVQPVDERRSSALGARAPR